jgi:hypothetical protein
MAETLGMLCDKLTIVKLKEYHTEDKDRLKSLASQSAQLQQEIDRYVSDAVAGRIPENELTFAANKVFKKGDIQISEVSGLIGEIFYQLADVNCKLWHEQEKVYEFEKVPAGEKDLVVKQLAILNLQRNKCIDAINQHFANMISGERNK